jgi:hypothetical protein
MQIKLFLFFNMTISLFTLKTKQKKGISPLISLTLFFDLSEIYAYLFYDAYLFITFTFIFFLSSSILLLKTDVFKVVHMSHVK